MSNVAEKKRYQEAFMEEATVVAREGRTIIVQAEGRALRARRAASCLLEPEAGDRVLLAWVGDERFVLAVLERDEAQPSRLTVEGDLEVRLPRGRFVVASQEGIDLTTAGEAQVTSRTLSLNAIEGNVLVQKLRMLGTSLEGEVTKLKLVAGQVDSLVERVRERIKRSYRFVEEYDQVRAANLDYRAEHTARVHAENTLMTAEQLVKVDGEQVHIG